MDSFSRFVCIAMEWSFGCWFLCYGRWVSLFFLPEMFQFSVTHICVCYTFFTLNFDCLIVFDKEP